MPHRTTRGQARWRTTGTGGARRSRRSPRQIARWAWTEGAQVSVSQVAKDLDEWADAYRAKEIPAAYADRALTVAQAAEKLGVSAATVRRYLAPSSGKLARLGDGVSARSIAAYMETRRNNIVRTRWTRASAPRRAAA